LAAKYATIAIPTATSASSTVDDPDGAVGGDTGQWLEAERCRGRKRTSPGMIDPPPLSKPRAHRPGHPSADEDGALAPNERSNGSHAHVRVLGRAERHQGVADKR